MGTTNNVTTSYVVEVTEGTIPGTPAFQDLPVTSNSLNKQIDTAVSDAINDTGMTEDLIVTKQSVSGDVGYELSYDAYKPVLTELMLNGTTGSVNETTVSVTSTTVLSKAALETAIPFGTSFRLSSVTTPALDGVYVCSNDGTAGQITISPALPSAGVETDLVLTTTTTIDAANETPNSYTIRTKVLGESDVPYYYYASGCKFTGLSIDVPQEGKITGTINIMGMEEKASGTAEAGETITPVAAYSILSSASSVAEVVIDGITVGTCSTTKLAIKLDTKAQELRSIKGATACGISTFGLDATSDVEFYFRNVDLYNLFKSSTSFALAFNLIDGDGDATNTANNVIGITFPYCKLNSLSKPISGKDAFITESGSITALKHPTKNTNVQLSFIDGA